MNSLKFSYQKKAAIIANNLKKTTGLSLSDCWKKAHSIVKQVSSNLVEIVKQNGEKSIRVVAKKLQDIYSPKESGKKKAEGLTLFADLSKYATGANFIISTYNYILIA
jgi:dephospho-CoA kinase